MQRAFLHADVLRVLLLCDWNRVAAVLRALPNAVAVAVAAVAAAAVKAAAAATAAVEAAAVRSIKACAAQLQVTSRTKEGISCHVSSAAATTGAVAERTGVRAHGLSCRFYFFEMRCNVQVSSVLQSGCC
jgi:hypothetical protein